VENLETVRVCKLGMHVDVSLTVSPIFSGTGEIIGVSNISHDITRRKLAEEKLRLAVEACPGGIIMVDGEGVITLVNAEAERLFGYSRTELSGRPVEILVPGAARGAHVDFRRQYGANPQRRMMGAGRNLHGVRKDGSEFPIEIGLNPIKIRGEVMVLSVVIDITERRRFEEAAAEINRDLQRSNDELRQFAYVASHDLQEPLRMVASYTELLAERYVGQLDTAADKYIQYAVEGARRMQHLVGDLLAYSRVGTEGKPFVPTDTRQVLKTVLENLQRTILETGAQIVFDEMPTIKADATQLCQLFQNLISNAVKFRADRPPHVRIEARKAGDEWEFTVQDNGIGIGEAYRGRIFQMFQRLHDRSTYDGNGIGLALAKKIVERHGGRIWCTSKPGEGTTFHFTMSERSGFG
jgi:PAS domain S-box-containing protein